MAIVLAASRVFPDLRMVQESCPARSSWTTAPSSRMGLTAEILSDAALLEAHGLEVY